MTEALASKNLYSLSGGIPSAQKRHRVKCRADDRVRPTFRGRITHLIVQRFSQQRFELGEELFDWVEVGAVGRQVAQLGAGSFDGLLDAGDLDDDVVWPQDGDHKLLDIGAKAHAIHWPVEHTRCGDFLDAQGGNECRCLSMTPQGNCSLFHRHPIRC
jgi:hypothetical protein